MTVLSTTSAWSRTSTALVALYREYEAEQSFAHLRAGGVNFVPGDGSLEPRVILIGEAPGVQEDRQQKPFVGASGSMLSALLRDVGILRHECWITNVIKYRPADNRTPTAEEVEAARPYLRREVAVLGEGCRRLPPVVLLGATALRLVEPDLRVSQVRGELIEHGAWTFLPLYHPAAALRNGNLLKNMRKDMRLLRRML